MNAKGVLAVFFLTIQFSIFVHTITHYFQNIYDDKGTISSAGISGRIA